MLVMCHEELPSQVRVAYYSLPASSTSAGESHTGGRLVWRRHHEATRPWTTLTTSNYLRPSARPTYWRLSVLWLRHCRKRYYGSDQLWARESWRSSLWAGEGEAPTPAFIARQPSRRCARATFYTYQRGIPQLRQAVAAYVRRHFLADVDPERVIITGSGMQAIMQTVQALVGPGDEVVVVSPVWPNIFAAIHMQEAIARPVPLQYAQDAWHLDLDRLFDACGPKTRALFLNTPGNPTGWMMGSRRHAPGAGFCPCPRAVDHRR